jgi:hypothetical protein
LRASTIEERLLCFLREKISLHFPEMRGEVPQNAVLRRKLKQPRSIRHSYKCGDFLRIGLWRGAFEQDQPLVLERT